MKNKSLFIPAFLMLASCFSFAADATKGTPFERCNTPSCNPKLAATFNLDTPPLEGDEVIGETFFVEDGLPALYKTSFAPESIVAVYNPRTGYQFRNGIDYKPAREGIELLPGSSIRGAPAGFSSPSAAEMASYGTKLSTQITSYQYAITYKKKEHYRIKSTGFLNKVKSSAKDGKIRITFLGDAISRAPDSLSAPASGVQPGYVTLVMSKLEALAPGKFLYRNNSADDLSSLQASWGIDSKLNDQRSDLVVLALGMNDSNNLPPEKYRANLENIIKKVRQKNPDTAFVLIAPIRPNKDSKIHHSEYFNKYESVLNELAIDNENIKSIDVTNAWDRISKNKKFNDLTANGLHLPNDYVHRVIAETVLATLSKI